MDQRRYRTVVFSATAVVVLIIVLISLLIRQHRLGHLQIKTDQQAATTVQLVGSKDPAAKLTGSGTVGLAPGTYVVRSTLDSKQVLAVRAVQSSQTETVEPAFAPTVSSQVLTNQPAVDVGIVGSSLLYRNALTGNIEAWNYTNGAHKQFDSTEATRGLSWLTGSSVVYKNSDVFYRASPDGASATDFPSSATYATDPASTGFGEVAGDTATIINNDGTSILHLPNDTASSAMAICGRTAFLYDNGTGGNEDTDSAGTQNYIVTGPNHYTLPSHITAAAWSPDCTRLAVIHDSLISLYGATGQKISVVAPADVASLNWDNSGNLLFGYSEAVWQYNPSKEQSVAKILNADSDVTSLKTTGDGFTYTTYGNGTNPRIRYAGQDAKPTPQRLDDWPITAADYRLDFLSLPGQDPIILISPFIHNDGSQSQAVVDAQRQAIDKEVASYLVSSNLSQYKTIDTN